MVPAQDCRDGQPKFWECLGSNLVAGATRELPSWVDQASMPGRQLQMFLFTETSTPLSLSRPVSRAQLAQRLAIAAVHVQHNNPQTKPVHAPAHKHPTTAQPGHQVGLHSRAHKSMPTAGSMSAEAGRGKAR